MTVRVPAGLAGISAWRRRCAAAGSGLECLSGIPGQVGLAVQNVGAYGVEVGSVLQRVQLVNRTTGRSPGRLSTSWVGLPLLESEVYAPGGGDGGGAAAASRWAIFPYPLPRVGAPLGLRAAGAGAGRRCARGGAGVAAC